MGVINMSKKLARKGQKLAFITAFLYKPFIKDLEPFLGEGRYTHLVHGLFVFPANIGIPGDIVKH